MKRWNLKLKPSADLLTWIVPAMLSVGFAAVVFACLWGFGEWNPLEIDTSVATGVAQKLLCSFGVAALLGSLIFVLSRAVLRDADAPAEERPVWFYPVVSGLLSLGVMIVAYSFVGMWPFGEKTGMVVDMHHQYAPLLSGLRDSILTGDLSLYSFEVGLGANYLSLFAYYMASPFNLLLLLFPQSFLAEGILFITLLKNAMCGAMFALCVQEVFGKRNLTIPAVSVMYSLMMYLLAYSWNIMWLDVVMVLPLVIYGFERMMKTGKFLTYVLSLAYALYANYYIAFMLCIFMVLYYAAYCAREVHSGREFGIGFARIAGYSVLAVCLTAVLLVPVYMALKVTSAAGADLPEITNTLDMFELLGRHLAGTSPTIRSGNLPNMYCGVLAMIAVPLFALNKGIPLRRRLAYIALWLVLAVTFLVNWTDLAWHGLHAPNDLPYRFSFLYSFVLLLMVFEVLQHVDTMSHKQVFGTFAALVVYLMVEERFGKDTYDFATVYINLGLIAVYTVILALATRRKFRRHVLHALLLLVITAELTFNAGYALVQVNNNEYFTRHVDYLDNSTSVAVQAAVKEAQRLGDEKYGEGTYRIEVLPRRTCVDTALFHYAGITNFASSNYYTTTKLMGGLGYAINGVNSHLYESFMPFTDSLFGIRYLVSTANLKNHPQLTHRSTVTNGDKTYYVYENRDALALGYVVDSSVQSFSYSKYHPFTSMQDLFSSMNSTYLTLFDYNGFVPETDTGAQTGHGAQSFRVQPASSGETARFTATIEYPGQVYIFVDCTAAKKLAVQSGDNNWNPSPNEPYIIDAGTRKKGDTVTLDVTAEKFCSGNFFVVTLNNEAYKKGLDLLRNEELKVTKRDGNRVEGTVDASFSGTMMTTIPYDKGWTVKVDGKVVKTSAIGEGLLAFKVNKGEHTVEMVYYPSGWWIGLGISVIAWIVLLLLWRPDLRRVKAWFVPKKQPAPATVPTENTPAEIEAEDVSIELPPETE